MKRHESQEDYLETILILKKRLTHVKSIDIVNEMNFSKPSISIAMKILKADGLIEVKEHGYIELTEKGLDIANKTLDKHNLLTDVLIKIGVNKDQALIDACKIEHDISDETYLAIKNYWDQKKSS